MSAMRLLSMLAMVSATAATLEVIKGEWIVVFHDNATVEQRADHLAKFHQNGVMAQYEIEWFKGYHYASEDSSILANIQSDPLVKYVEPNGMVYAYQSCNVRTVGSWGLVRVNQRNLPSWTGPLQVSDQAEGFGVTQYTIDTGILTTHNDFGGRAFFGVSYVAGQNDDGHGHGTHVASTTVGSFYGLAQKSEAFAVKVLNNQGSGTLANVISGVNWSVNHNNGRTKEGVANLSLGGGRSQPLDDACNAAMDAGLLVVVAAGNNNGDACQNSPAGAEGVITVAASDNTDTKASFSNWGTCVDIYGPGVAITAAWIGSNTATNSASGTSMASPHIAGIAEEIWSDHPELTAHELKQKVLELATPGKIIGNPTNTPNLLGYAACPSSR